MYPNGPSRQEVSWSLRLSKIKTDLIFDWSKTAWSVNSLLTGTDGEAIYEKDKMVIRFLVRKPLPRKLSMVRISIRPFAGGASSNLPRNGRWTLMEQTQGKCLGRLLSVLRQVKFCNDTTSDL